MNGILKKLLMCAPQVRRFVNRLDILRIENSRLQEEISRLERVREFSKSPALSQSEADLLTDKLLSHPVTNPFPEIHLGNSRAEDNPHRVAVAERLLTAYHKAIADENQSRLRRDGEDLWSALIRSELPELMSIIDEKNAVKLADYLMHFGESFVWFGGITTCIDGYNKNLNPEHVALTYFDKLVCLAEYLGVLPVENPENGPWGENIHADAQELVEKIEGELGIPVMPRLGAVYTDGIEAGDGLLHYRHINALYCATRIKELLRDGDAACCEFGGGIGITAMYARELGVSRYTILDLPITCLLAGHYLLHTCGLDSVCLYGEERSAGAIEVLPYWECLNLADNEYQITINQDSFPEIADNLLNEYLVQIRRLTSRYFLSMNHEYFYPRTVKNFVRQAEGYRQVYRSKYWVREGYVEELFELT